MSGAFYFFVALYTCIFCFGHYIMMGAAGRHRCRQAVKYVYVALKMLVAVATSPLLILLFIVSPKLFLPVFTFLWPHLDILGDDGSLYLRRWFMTPKTQWFCPRFLHYIARSDEGRDPHDHPGRFVTKILKTGYREYVYYPRDQMFRTFYGMWASNDARAGAVRNNGVGHTHMVSLVWGPAWTWVIGWIRGKPWGFWVLDPVDASKDRWIESKEYGAKSQERASWEARQ